MEAENKYTEEILDPKKLRDFDRCAEWFFANAERIEEEYNNKFIAVLKPGKIMAADDLDNLMKELEEEGIDIRKALITGIPEIGTASIL